MPDSPAMCTRCLVTQTLLEVVRTVEDHRVERVVVKYQQDALPQQQLLFYHSHMQGDGFHLAVEDDAADQSDEKQRVFGRREQLDELRVAGF